MIKRGLILTGGKGTRLHTINNDALPKALMQLDQQTTFLDYTIEFLTLNGITDICVSVRHQKEKIIDYITKRYTNSSTLTVSLQEEHEDVGTGGALFLYAQRDTQPFIALPVDYYYLNPDISLFDISFTDDYVLIWYASKNINKFTQPHVIHNIYFDKKTTQMKGYLSTATPEEREFWTNVHNKNTGITRGSSMGLIAVNSKYYVEKIRDYNFSFPFCIYKDVAPAWIKTYGNPVEQIKVKSTNVDVIDMGIPVQYRYIQKKYYESDSHST